MSRQPSVPGEQLIDLQFPIEGVNEERPFSRQRQGTTFDASNVRTIDPRTQRARGASRSGMVKFFDSPAVALNAPIQDLNQLDSTTLPSAIALGGFVYGQAAGSGFGIAGTTTGSSAFAGLGAVADFQFANSCWGVDSDLYAATVNSTTGATKIYRISSAGAVVWTQTALTVATGSLRHVAGMVVVGQYLFICLVTTAAPYTLNNPDCRIVRLLISTGAIDSNPWRIAGTGQSMYFSSNAVNCIGKIGNIIAVDCANPSNLALLLLFDATTAATTGASFRGYYLYGGTTTHNRAKVVSDGQTFFYVIASTNSAILRKVGIVGNEGSAIWTSSAVGTPNGICFDQTSGQLVAAAATSPSIQKINQADGNIASTPAGLGATIWTDIDSDNRGNFVAWQNSVASGDVIGLASNLGSQWGPSTLANTVHNGASVNKGIDPNLAAQETTSRAIRLLGVSNGTVFRFDEDGPVSLTGGVALSSAARQIFSAQLGLNLFYVDGVSYKYYRNLTDTVVAWTATDGTLPVDSPIPSCARGIEPWRGRLILFDFQQNPQRFYMCKQGDAFGWNTSPSTTSTIQAIASTTPGFNYPGERINCVIPYTDDTALFGDANRIWILRGDLADGGAFDLVSPEMGMVRGRPWARDQFGQIFFMASDGRIYKMTPGSMPIKISQQIDKRLLDVDLRTVVVRMAWDMDEHGLHVWMTSTTGTSAHFFYEERLSAWFPVSYGKEKHSPFAILTLKGDDPESRRILVGGQDGYVRVLGSTFEDDDGTPIDSYVWIILMTRDLDFLTLRDLQARLAEGSEDVTWEAYVGRTVEEAKASSKAASGIWTAGFNPVSPVWQSGHVVLVKLSSSRPWALERIAAWFTPLGPVLRRI